MVVTRSQAKPTLIDVFCGVGGLTLGALQAGFDVRLAADNWAPAVRSYRLNFAHPCAEVDLGDASGEQLIEAAGLSFGQLDVLAGGPPCQGFSIQRVGRDQDPRNDLVLSFIRLVREMRPRIFVMENVRGLIGRRGRPVLQAALAEASECGYQVEVAEVDAADFGVPQHRRRIVVLGVMTGLPRMTLRSSAEPMRVSTWEAIGDLPAPVPRGVRTDDPLHVETALSDLNRQRLAHIPPGGGFEDLPVELRVRAHRNGARRIGHRAVYGRLHPDAPASTITARFDSFTRGRFAHPREDRNITLREGARLQGFPDQHQFTGTQEEIAALIGNAVPPPMASAIFTDVARHLRRECCDKAGGSQPTLLDDLAVR